MKLFTRIIRRLLLKWPGKGRIERIIVNMARLLDVDLLQIAYNNIGILNYENLGVSGEKLVITQILPGLLRSGKPVIFDVGANVGEFSLSLIEAFPGAEIWAFEPNPNTYSVLLRRLDGCGVRCVNLGLGSRTGKLTLHTYSHDAVSGHASLYRDVFKFYEGYGIKGADKLESFECDIGTIDAFVEQNGIRQVDFMKIDVEGHELEVLKGALESLRTDKISAIQFEFTDCNVTSRVYLKDFYDLLNGFGFYRLNTLGLIPLGQYATRNEIFQFQNILAIRNDLSANISEFLR